MEHDETDAAAVVQAFLTTFEAMDFDAALPFLADDCEYTNVPLGTVRGHAGVRSVLEPFFAPIHENEFVILRRAADGPVVVVAPSTSCGDYLAMWRRTGSSYWRTKYYLCIG
mgnify:CR=1 FL=1